MRLMTLKNFRSLIYAEGSEPSMGTLRARIKNHQIAGGLIDESGRYYVDMDEFDRKHHLMRSLLERHAQLAASPELEGLI